MDRGSRHDDFFPFYPPSRPRQVQGGIKLQSRHGAIGQRWWARRWMEVLETLDLGGRLSRGRSYARQGQVLSIDIAKGMVTARVQGSRPQPYKVQIKFKSLARSQWEKLARVLSRRAIFAAKLLSGEMPNDIEEAFREAGLSLFPGRLSDLATDCSCPDWSNPCKHIAAVYYLLGEEFDRDPFLVFTLRGMARDELVGLLVSRPAGPDAKIRGAQASPLSTLDAPEPLPAEAEAFWGGAGAEQDAGAEVTVPTVAASLAKRLGSFPFWRGEEDFFTVLEAIYRMASPVGQAVFLGWRPGPGKILRSRPIGGHLQQRGPGSGHPGPSATPLDDN